MTFAAGQRWTYRAPQGFEDSRLVIGAVVRFDGSDPILCCSVSAAPRRCPDGSVDVVSIPFLPMTEAAVRATVVARDGEAAVDDDFQSALAAWQSDDRGLSYFTVAFEGFLDRMIALQMADIVGQSAA